MLTRKNKGFTLLEVLVALFIIVVGIVGVINLLQQTNDNLVLSSSKLVANYLGQEGIEIVRNIRDENWLRARMSLDVKWDDFIPVGDWEADYTSHQLIDEYDGDYLLANLSGFYNYTLGDSTKFKRKITIEKVLQEPEMEAYIIKVTVRVEWADKKGDHYISAQENLYRWR